MTSSALEVDHLVVGARTLDEGVRWCEATLGLTPGPGGRHALMSTHNRLFFIGSAEHPQAYFEIIAIDPEASAPGRARWFGLDTQDLSRGPRLLHWVARARPIDAVLARLSALGVDAGRVLSASRETPDGCLQWRIAVRDDGALLHHGALPTLIEWGHTHPAAAMFPVGVQLRRLVLRGLSQPVWSALALSSVAEPPERDDPRAHGLSAVLDTPRGRITLHSA